MRSSWFGGLRERFSQIRRLLHDHTFKALRFGAGDLGCGGWVHLNLRVQVPKYYKGLELCYFGTYPWGNISGWVHLSTKFFFFKTASGSLGCLCHTILRI